MNATRRRLSILLAACLAPAAARASLPDAIIRGIFHRWSAPSASAGRLLVGKYGLPDDATLNRLTWLRKGAWKRTVVWNRKQVYRSLSDMAVLEQTVDYPLSPAQAAELLAFRDSLVVDLERGELSSRSDREEVNYLTLNLADDIVRGDTTAARARKAFADILALEASGKASPYLAGLLFLPGRGAGSR